MGASKWPKAEQDGVAGDEVSGHAEVTCKRLAFVSVVL